MPCCPSHWDGEGCEDRQKSIVEMESVKNLSLEKEHLLRAHDNVRALHVQPLWQQQFGSVRSLQCPPLDHEDTDMWDRVQRRLQKCLVNEM